MPIDPNSIQWDEPTPKAAPSAGYSKSLLDSALAAEGVSGSKADFIKSIYQQESGSGSNTTTSNRGAVGGAQIIPATFNSVADKGWNINNPEQNLRAGIRYASQGFDASGGDPALAGAYYYGGPGGMAKAKQGIAVSDPVNPKAPNTLQYGAQVAARMPAKQNPVMQAVGGAVNAVMPSAQAAPLAPKIDPNSIKWDEPAAKPAEQGTTESIGAGLGKGFGSTMLGAQHYLGRGLDYASQAMGAVGNGGATATKQLGDWLVQDAASGKANLATQNAPYKASNPIANGLGEFGGEVVATLPVGGVLGNGLKAAGATRMGTAVSTGGFSTGAKVAPGFIPAVQNLAIQSVGGGINGYASAGLVNSDSANMGGAVGAFIPVVGKGIGLAANAAGSAVRPFFAKGQDRIAGDTLREFAESPKNALSQLLNSGEVVAGSAPTTATAAGDNGLASLSRAMQNADPRFAAELATRQTAQNQARTAALEGIAGNTGKLDIAKAARDAATSPMREGVLDAAGKVPVDSVLSKIDRLIANPNNAGELSQQALGKFRASIAKASQDGHIDARALYEIRKDIGTTLSGKLQGDAGNLRYAAGQLNNVKGVIDDAIDLASRKVQGTGTELMPYGANISTHTMPNPVASQTPRASWADYLQKYTNESIPINQMEKLDKVMKSIQTGTVDSQGGMVLSGAKLNNILKNEGSDLTKMLSPAQMDILRKVSADLNAGQIANNAGRAVGSNTLQNMAQNQFLTNSLGKVLGGSTGATSTLGRALQLPYGAANKQIMERLGNALLDPKEAARLMADPKTNKLLNLLSAPQQLGYRVAPLIYAQ